VGGCIRDLADPRPREGSDQGGIADMGWLVAAFAQDHRNLLDGVAEGLDSLRLFGLEADPVARVFGELAFFDGSVEHRLNPGDVVLNGFVRDLPSIGLFQQRLFECGEVWGLDPSGVMVAEMFGKAGHVAAFVAARPLVGVL
jgi:hypothetical protein